ncbi:beta-N-acetylglucosaminidase NAG3 precursor [Tribolium castaneum]|nr:beta-N-acetylglucosaminidase NAG3 precursor [Tribolium castaneum]ABQ95984.1 beta-N-acetylglucosaminidase NAG3 [Tribolium castaneum]|eukprot:NP_001092297.1 beta-N-acetylglucosaminidase NAG3 precursor [Tribolium castaneum]
MLVVFVVCCLLLMFSYTDNVSSTRTKYLRTNFPNFYNDFEVQRYTWKCENQKCVKYLVEDEETSLATCNMLCSEPAIWPKPVHIKLTNRESSIIDKTKISFNFSQGPVKIMLQNATDLFIKSLESLKPGNQSTPGIKLSINIILSDPNTNKLKLNTNESYELTVLKSDSLAVRLSAANFFGARHGLETLNQLIWFDEVVNELRILHGVEIRDYPKFPYRGVMIDTARNFFPVDLIRKVVDGMAMAKLNVLHLHLTDAVSFPIVLPKVQELARFGAYGPDMIYTPQDIRDLLQYSLVRGVRLLLEVDAPSHVNAGWSFLQEGANKFVICGESDIFNGHLNPDNDEVLQVLEDIYSDLLDLTDNNELFHLGSDEVNLTCWQDTKSANKIAMKLFWAQYTNKMIDRLKNANNNELPEHVIMWSSPLTESPYFEKLDVKVTVQLWLGDPSSVLSHGHRVIYSTVGHWYLDCGFGPWKPSMHGGVCDPYTPWHTFYDYRPWVQHGHQELVLGGEVCLWSEQVGPDSLETRIWPRSAAFAERIWSDPSAGDDYDIYTRLVSFSDRLKSRGIRTAAIWPLWCSQNPGKC